MYLPDFMLRELCERQGLVVPYDPGRVNPASIDLGLGRDFVNLSETDIVYLHEDGEGKGTLAKPGERFEAYSVFLRPGVALLACTQERVTVPDSPIELHGRSYLDESGRRIYPYHPVEACVAELRLKSSAARAGLDHALAGWIDPGFRGQLTLELHAHRPVELITGKCYVQFVVAACLAAPERSYQVTGRYVGAAAQGAVLARDVEGE